MGEHQEKEMQVLVIKKKERKKRVGQQAQNWCEGDKMVLDTSGSNNN